jgi:sulfur relay (sulfurtransferase) complex TusBCD TusD component (DsrE family)
MSIRATVVLITANGMGKGPQDLQQKLFAKYLDMLIQQNEFPAAICFYTEGVYLVTAGSPVIQKLARLEAQGVRLIVCSTCLEYFSLTENVRVGIIGTMGDILEAQWKAEKVITI